MLHNVAYLPNHAFKMKVFSPYDSKLHEKRNELVKDQTFKVKVKVKFINFLKAFILKNLFLNNMKNYILI